MNCKVGNHLRLLVIKLPTMLSLPAVVITHSHFLYCCRYPLTMTTVGSYSWEFNPKLPPSS
eukprot:scaffold124713_cov33-Prasinocladus_malaysianus.AAC.2